MQPSFTARKMWPLLRLLSVLWVWRLSSGQLAVPVPDMMHIHTENYPGMMDPVQQLSNDLHLQDGELHKLSQELQTLQNRLNSLETKLSQCQAGNTIQCKPENQNSQPEQQNNKPAPQLDVSRALQDKLKSIEDSMEIFKETQKKELEQQAGRLEKLEKLLSLNNNKAAEVLNVLNETQTTQLNQEMELKRYSDKLWTLQEDVRSLDDYQKNISKMRTKEGLLHGHQLAKQAQKLTNLEGKMTSVENKLAKQNTTLDALNKAYAQEKNQGFDLHSNMLKQATQLQDHEYMLQQHSGQMQELLTDANSTKASLQANTNDIKLVKETQDRQDSNLADKMQKQATQLQSQDQKLQRQSDQLQKFLETVKSSVDSNTEVLKLLKGSQESQGAELAGKVQKQEVQLTNQQNTQQQHSDKLQHVLETIKSIRTSVDSNTEDLKLLNKTQERQGAQLASEIQKRASQHQTQLKELQQHSDQLQHVLETVKSMKTSMDSNKADLQLFTKTQGNQEADLTSQVQKQATQLQLQDKKLRQHSDQLQNVQDTVKSIEKNVDSNTEDLRILNKTQVSQEAALNTKMRKQGNLLGNHERTLQQHSDQLQSVLDTVKSMKTSVGSNTGDLKLLKTAQETQRAEQASEIQKQATELQKLQKLQQNSGEQQKFLQNVNATVASTAADLKLLNKAEESQKTELSSELTKQASQLQKHKDELQQQSAKLKEFVLTLDSVKERLESNTNGLKRLNKTHEIDPLQNVALRKPATMSSQVAKYSPDRAVDGGHNTHIQYCFHTQNTEQLLWWMVDLQGFYKIFSVVITNRRSPSGVHMKDFEAQVFKQNPMEVKDAHYDLCYKHPGSMGIAATEEYVCTKPFIGRYLRLAMENGKPPRPMHLCEVEVWAMKEEENTCAADKNYVLVQGHKANGDVLREVTSASSAAQCVEWCNTDMRCSAANVGNQKLVSDKWSVDCRLLSMGGIGQTSNTTAVKGWDLYLVANP